jgi:hypothetical protein
MRGNPFLYFQRAAEARGYPALLIVSVLCLALVVAPVALLGLTRAVWVLALALLSVIVALAILAGAMDAAFSDPPRPTSATLSRHCPDAPQPQRNTTAGRPSHARPDFDHSTRAVRARPPLARPASGVTPAKEGCMIGIHRSADRSSSGRWVGALRRGAGPGRPAWGRARPSGGGRVRASLRSRTFAWAGPFGRSHWLLSRATPTRRLKAQRVRGGWRSGSARRGCACRASRAHLPGGGRRSSC